MSIKIEHLTCEYMKGTPFAKKALDDIDLEIADGELTAIIGHTGSGKSTLIQHLNGLIRPKQGRIIIDGVPLGSRHEDLVRARRSVGVVFQYPEYQLFESTVEKDIAFGPINMGLSEEEVMERVRTSMEMVGLNYEAYRNDSPFSLSGGYKKRVTIAGVLAMKPHTLVLDEPTAGLDPIGRKTIYDLIRDLHEKSGLTVVIVSHSMEDMADLAKRIVVLNQGRIAFDGTPNEVFAHCRELEEMSLAVPQVTYLAMKLREKGFDLPDEIYTVDDARKAIMSCLRYGKRVEEPVDDPVHI